MYHEMTRFQRDLLVVIAGHDHPKGLRIKQQLEDDGLYQNIHHGRIYPNLDELAERGLIEKGEKDKRTNYYELTEKGANVLRDRREWENTHVAELGDQE